MHPSQNKANYSFLQLQLENATVSQSHHKHSEHEQNHEAVFSYKVVILFLMKMFCVCTVQCGSPESHVVIEH